MKKEFLFKDDLLGLPEIKTTPEKFQELHNLLFDKQIEHEWSWDFSYDFNQNSIFVILPENGVKKLIEILKTYKVE